MGSESGRIGKEERGEGGEWGWKVARQIREGGRGREQPTKGVCPARESVKACRRETTLDRAPKDDAIVFSSTWHHNRPATRVKRKEQNHLMHSSLACDEFQVVYDIMHISCILQTKRGMDWIDMGRFVTQTQLAPPVTIWTFGDTAEPAHTADMRVGRRYHREPS